MILHGWLSKAHGMSIAFSCQCCIIIEFFPKPAMRVPVELLMGKNFCSDKDWICKRWNKMRETAGNWSGGLMFASVLSNMFTLCIMMAFGFFARKWGVITDGMTAGLSRILLYLTSPCLILMSMQRPFTPALLQSVGLTFLISLTLHGIFFTAGRFIFNFLRLSRDEKNVFVFAMTFSNIVFLGFPVLSGALGEESLFYGSISNIAFNILVFTLGVQIISPGDGSKGIQWRQILSPAVVTSILGIVLFLGSVRIPEPVGKALTLTGNMTTPLSMLIIGALLTESNLKSLFLDYRLYLLSFVRLMAAPLLVFFVLRLFIHEPMLLYVLTILSGLPAASTTAIFAERYGGDAVFASQVVFNTTLLSVVTIPILVFFIQSFV